MRILIVTQLVIALQLFTLFSADAGDIGPGTSITFDGAIFEDEDISGIAKVGDSGEFLVIGSDEGHAFQILEKVNDSKYKLKQTYNLRTKKEDDEVDIEGVAAVDSTIYITGSHSRKRKKVTLNDPDDRDYDDNFERLTTGLAKERSRRVIYRFDLDSRGELKGDIVERDDLYDYLEDNPPFEEFTKIPSKENGIDIEGIAAHDSDSILVGFRAPVLRQNWVPILNFKFSEGPSRNAVLLFVNLGGLGIRDITRVSNGFLIIAGPMGDGPGDYKLYHWDGNCMLPGDDGPSGKLKPLGTIPTEPGTKAEGIVVLEETNTHYSAIIVWDGIRNGGATKFDVNKARDLHLADAAPSVAAPSVAAPSVGAPSVAARSMAVRSVGALDAPADRVPTPVPSVAADANDGGQNEGLAISKKFAEGPALDLLQRAYRATKANDSTTKEEGFAFAVELKDLTDVGVTKHDLRWLVTNGDILHLKETSTDADTHRKFEKIDGLNISDRACFVLTEKGAEMAAKLIKQSTATTPN